MNRTPGKTAEEKESYWTTVIEEARQFPAGVAAYCTSKGIGKNNYYFWFKRLRASHPEWTNLSIVPEQSKARERHTQPETEVATRARRRRFSAKDKARILRETEASSKGQVAAILRREGLYASQLCKWKVDVDRVQGKNRKRGRKANPLTVRVNSLQAQCAQLEKQLKQANAIIELQKKVSEVLGVVLQESETQ